MSASSLAIAVFIGLGVLALAFSGVSLWPWLQYLSPASKSSDDRKLDKQTSQIDIHSIAPKGLRKTESPNRVPLSPPRERSAARDDERPLKK